MIYTYVLPIIGIVLSVCSYRGLTIEELVVYTIKYVVECATNTLYSFYNIYKRIMKSINKYYHNLFDKKLSPIEKFYKRFEIDPRKPRKYNVGTLMYTASKIEDEYIDKSKTLFYYTESMFNKNNAQYNKT